MSSFNSLTLALEGWFDKPLCDLPDALRKRIEDDFEPMPWDRLTALGRRDVAQQVDAIDDPALEQVRQFGWDHADRKIAILTRIAEWEGIATPTALDLAQKETRLAELRPELTRIEAEKFATALNGEDSPSAANQPSTADPRAAFLAMENLIANELNIAFVGDQSESSLGANNMLEITARKETRRIAVAELNLVDRRQGTLNSQGVILLGMAQRKKLTHSANNATKVKRLRDVFRNYFGVKGDPFEPYRKGAGWVPHFKITDKRGAADERAKREAERRTDSYEELIERGDNFTAPNQSQEHFDDEDDAASDWLKDNDPDAPA
jgi:hypothetical protein